MNSIVSDSVNINSLLTKLVSLKQAQFSGRLVLRDIQTHPCSIYFFCGRVLYVKGGEHSIRRLQRNIEAHLPGVDLQQFYFDTVAEQSMLNTRCWEYQLLLRLFEQKQATHSQLTQIIHGIISEVLFDILQLGQGSYALLAEEPLSPQIVLFDTEQILMEVETDWQAWQQLSISCSLNQVPAISKPDLFQKKAYHSLYGPMLSLIDGRSSLRDIALHTQSNTVSVIESLLPYIRSGLISLHSIPDLPVPFTSSSEVTDNALTQRRETAIACISNSSTFCEFLRGVLTGSGYQFIEVNRPLRSIATLLEHKPELIVLNLVNYPMSEFEICTQLRKVDELRNIPIVIMTDSISMKERIRGKLARCTDLLDKRLAPEGVLSVISKHLFACAA